MLCGRIHPPGTTTKKLNTIMNIDVYRVPSPTSEQTTDDCPSFNTSSTISDFEGSSMNTDFNESDLVEKTDRIREKLSLNLAELPKHTSDYETSSPGSGGSGGSGGKSRKKRILDAFKKPSAHKETSSISPKGDRDSVLSPRSDEKKSPKSPLSRCIDQREMTITQADILPRARSVPNKHTFSRINYNKLQHVSTGRENTFNKHFISDLKAMIDTHFGKNLSKDDIDIEMSHLIQNYVSTFNDNKKDLDINYTSIEKEKEIVSKLICDAKFQEFKHTILLNRFNLLLTLAGIVLDDKKFQSQRSDKTDTLVKKLEGILEEIKVGKWNGLDDKCEFRSLFLKMFHEQEDEAVETLDRIKFWLSGEVAPLLLDFVNICERLRILKWHAEHCRLTTFKTNEIAGRIAKTNNSYIANSYVLNKSLDYECIKIDDHQINEHSIKNIDCNDLQKYLFELVIKTLDAPGCDVDSLFSNKNLYSDFIGKDILWFGSDDGWKYCEEIIKRNYPALVSDGLSLHQGQRHLFDVTTQENSNSQVTCLGSYYILEGNIKHCSFIVKRTFFKKNPRQENAASEASKFTVEIHKITKIDATNNMFLFILNSMNMPVDFLMHQDEPATKTLHRSTRSRSLQKAAK